MCQLQILKLFFFITIISPSVGLIKVYLNLYLPRGFGVIHTNLVQITNILAYCIFQLLKK